MKTLKTTLFIAFLVISVSVWAQPQGRGEQGPPPIPNSEEITKMVTELGEELSLSDEQENKIETLYTEFFKMMEDKTSNSRPNREFMESLEADFQKEVKAVLNEEQIEKYEDFLKDQKSQRRR